MTWRQELLDRLSDKPCAGYGRQDSPATEPSALAALALVGAARHDPARQVARWLTEIQSADGAVGVRATESTPCWPTSLAVLVWTAIHQFDPTRPYKLPIENALEWIVATQGVKLPRHPHQGHDSMLGAWPWVDDTHTWVEPTAFHVLALKALGYGNHPRTRDALAMLIDRQLPGGGLNYGNTFVLGQQLRPHVQPTATALLALAGESSLPEKSQRSLHYLAAQLSPATTTTSLAWSLVALAAHGVFPPAADEWLESAYQRTLRRDQSHYKLSLIMLALQKQRALIVTLPAQTSATNSAAVSTTRQGTK